MTTTEKIAVRGLPRLAAGIFGFCGALAVLKGLRDCFGGEPEANFFSPRPWEFVTRAQWLRFAGFELAYGAACLGLAWAAWEYSKRLPAWTVRKTKEEGFLK
jgi:hypothetical protein